MAAGLLRHLWDRANPGWPLEVLSAGTNAFPGLEATEHAVTALRNRGLDITGHRSRVVDQVRLDEVDLILAMTHRHKEHILAVRPELLGRVHTLGEYAGSYHDIQDPFGGTLADYERTAQSLEQLLQAVVERIRREGTSV
jgi:protein-tyrosine-phosphatase